MGRLVSDKGADLALRAVKQINKVRPHDRPVTLTVIGDGPEKAPLMRLAAELQIETRINFTGILRGEVLVETLNRHRFLWIPSVWEEPFGNIALEGMACGCIPIASDGGGLPDAVGPGGTLFTRGDLESMVQTSIDLLNSPEKQDQLRQAAGDHLACHRPERIAKRYLEVIEEACAR